MGTDTQGVLGGRSSFEGHILKPGQQSCDSVLQGHTQKPCEVQASSGRRLRACTTALLSSPLSYGVKPLSTVGSCPRHKVGGMQGQFGDTSRGAAGSGIPHLQRLSKEKLFKLACWGCAWEPLPCK